MILYGQKIDKVSDFYYENEKKSYNNATNNCSFMCIPRIILLL